MGEDNNNYQKTFREKFLEIVKYYNEVVIGNGIIFCERSILQFQLHNDDINKKRSTFMEIKHASQYETKSHFDKYILTKIEDLQTNLITYNKQLAFFYKKYRSIYDTLSIIIIILSSSLSFIEGISLMLKYQGVYLALLVLVFSSSIAVMTSVLKFKSIKEKIELIVTTREKVNTCQANLFTFDKEFKTHLFLSDGIILHDDEHKVTIDGNGSAPC